jgi:hypothetical protein
MKTALVTLAIGVLWVALSIAALHYAGGDGGHMNQNGDWSHGDGE